MLTLPSRGNGIRKYLGSYGGAVKKGNLQILLLAICLTLSYQTHARDRVLKGVLVGGAVGAVAGDGMHDALKGAALGGGVAAITDNGRRGRDARDGAMKGAVVGAVVGGVAGDGMDDALKGAAWGAAGGAMIGHGRRSNDYDDRYYERRHGNKHRYKD